MKGILGPLSDIVDSYGRQARVMPALLTILPAALLIFVWFPALWTTLGVLVSIASSFGLMLLVSQLGRDRGKRLEGALWRAWDGKPSVVLLRHRDPRIDEHTKARYRDFIARRLTALKLPTSAQESADPAAADRAYESVTAWLLTQTRDTKKFPLVYRENVSYGFRRNLWGLKPVGLTIALLGAVVSTAAIAYRYCFEGAVPQPEVLTVTAVISILSLVWLFVVNPAWVRLPADAYAVQLLAACDTLDGPAVKAGARKKPA